MSLLTLRIYGDPVLRQRAREVRPEEIDDTFRQLAEDMGETMYAAQGIGLAANQIGETRRIFVADWDQVTDSPRRGKRTKDPKKRNLRVLINPVIISSSDEDEEASEGCLSIPELEADLFRPRRIRVQYRDLDWQQHEEELDDLPARVFQHELDHLDGILFIDRIGADARARLAGALSRIKKKGEETHQEAHQHV